MGWTSRPDAVAAAGQAPALDSTPMWPPPRRRRPPRPDPSHEEIHA
ncbi:hypothetical protein HMPREF0569_0616 [Micrococcus luteus SK58]|nr:hypothetical protein HMPREF0569_0616 [Micrococcus luteus SK58]